MKKATTKTQKQPSNLVIYRTKQGALEFKGDANSETMWATLDQIATLFGRDKSVISRHFKSIFAEKELLKSSTVAKNATVQNEGGREVIRAI